MYWDLVRSMALCGIRQEALSRTSTARYSVDEEVRREPQLGLQKSEKATGEGCVGGRRGVLSGWSQQE